MKIFSLLLTLAVMVLPQNLYAKGDFANKVSFDGIEFTLCTQTKIKAMAVFTVGYGAIYLENCKKSASPLNNNKVFTIQYSMDFTSEDFQMSSLELLKRNLSESVFLAIKDKAEAFNKNYLAVEEGDRYYVVSTPNMGLSLHLNNNKVASSTDTDLIQHYFSIWFGNKPFSKSMKKKLLNPLTL